MPAGDSQRVWFREMLARLEREWGGAMSFPALIELRDSLDTMLHQIRSPKHISSPVPSADSAAPWLSRCEKMLLAPKGRHSVAQGGSPGIWCPKTHKTIYLP